MNYKRKLPRVATSAITVPEYVELSSDGEDFVLPKAKRQKSVGIDDLDHESLLRDFLGQTHKSQPVHRRDESDKGFKKLQTTPKKSPFKSQPSWLARSPITSTVTAADNEQPTKRSFENGLSKRVESIDLTYDEDEKDDHNNVQSSRSSGTPSKARSTNPTKALLSNSTSQHPRTHHSRYRPRSPDEPTSDEGKRSKTKSKQETGKQKLVVSKTRLDIEGIRTKPSKLPAFNARSKVTGDKDYRRPPISTNDDKKPHKHRIQQNGTSNSISRSSNSSASGQSTEVEASPKHKLQKRQEAGSGDSAAKFRSLSNPQKIRFDPGQEDSITALMNEKKSSSKSVLQSTQKFQIQIPMRKPAVASLPPHREEPSRSSQSNSITQTPAVPTKPAKPSQPERHSQTPVIHHNLSIPRKSNIQVIIPSPQLDSAVLRAELQHRKPDPFVIRQQKRAIMEELRKSSTKVDTHMEQIQQLFGQFGFSKCYPTNLDEERMKGAAPLKKKKVDRSKIKLEWGDPPPAPTGPPMTNTREEALRILTKRFDEPFDPPLTFTNTINNRRIYGKFQFVSSYIIRFGVKVAPEERNYDCHCQGTCKPETCACFDKVVEKKKGKAQSTEHKQSKSRSPETDCLDVYIRHDDGLITLTDAFIAHSLDPSTARFEITECNSKCPCPSTCINRVVQHGRTVPLEIYMTERTGFGVRSSVDIRKGQFIDLYLGEVITTAELEKRENAKEENASSYVYSLDWFTKQSTSMYHVDGEIFGTAMRFINHSCVPNARSFVVLKHHADKSLYHLAFFAIRDIPAGTEIRIDYSPQDAWKTREENDLEEGTECLCGEKECRGRLWREGKVKRRKRKVVPE